MVGGVGEQRCGRLFVGRLENVEGVWVVACEVGGFASIAGEVEEEVAGAGDHWPVAHAGAGAVVDEVFHGAAAQCSLAGDTPHEVVLGVWFTVDEPGEKGSSIDGEGRIWAGATSVEEGGGPVHEDRVPVTALGRVQRSGPAGDERDADAAFGDVALLADEGPHVRISFATVVGRETDEGVIGAAGFVEHVEDRPIPSSIVSMSSPYLASDPPSLWNSGNATLPVV